MENQTSKTAYPPKTVLAIREAKLVQVRYTDASGIENVALATVFPDKSVYIIPKETIPLNGVNDWFAVGVRAAVEQSKIKKAPKTGGTDGNV